MPSRATGTLRGHLQPASSLYTGGSNSYLSVMFKIFLKVHIL